MLLCSCVFSVLWALQLPRLGKRNLILMLSVRLLDLRLFGFVCFLFLLVSGKGCVCDFYGDLVYRFRKIVGKSNFSEQFRKLINCYKRIGYSLDIMRQTACLVVNPIIVDGYASLFNCTTAVRASDSMTASS